MTVFLSSFLICIVWTSSLHCPTEGSQTHDWSLVTPTQKYRENRVERRYQEDADDSREADETGTLNPRQTKCTSKAHSWLSSDWFSSVVL